MRHRVDHRKLSRTASHRRALLRNLVTALFEYERIETSIAKAKETRRVAERMITFAKRGSLHARRHVARYVMKEAITKKLFDTIAPWYVNRQGGYTRILRTRFRLGDSGEMGILELVKSKEQLDAERKAREEAAEAAKAEGKKAGKKPKKAAEAAAEGEKPPKKAKPKREKDVEGEAAAKAPKTPKKKQTRTKASSKA
jgi:large subunit ribosomal protein L17